VDFCYFLHHKQFPLHYKQLRPWEVCNQDDPWSFAASNSLMHLYIDVLGSHCSSSLQYSKPRIIRIFTKTGGTNDYFRFSL